MVNFPRQHSAFGRIDSLCDEFELAWKSGLAPSIEDYLAAIPENERSELLLELLQIELFYLQGRQGEPQCEEYYQRFPGFEAQIDRAFFHTLDPTATDSTRSTHNGVSRTQRDQTPSPQSSADSSARSSKAAASPSPGKLSGLTPSSIIGQFVVGRKLGAGAMGEVWLGRDPRLERDVAIKVLPTEFAQDNERVSRFLREARLAARLHHTNAATIYQVGTENDLVFIAMEFVDGSSLEKIVSAGGPMDWRDATRAIRDAALGLAAAHELDLVHRDIKPANLMRTTKGITKVVDFGLAKVRLAATELTQQGAILGTPAYMAPEQWNGLRADGRSDIYSLICSYYFLLTGKVPFDALSLPMFCHQHLYTPFPDPRKLVPGLPDAVCHVLARGSQKEPANRYEKCTEIVEELNGVLATSNDSLTYQASWEGLTAEAMTVSAQTDGSRGAPEPALGTTRPHLSALKGRLHLAIWTFVAAIVIGVAFLPAALSLPSSGSVKIQLTDGATGAEIALTADLEVSVDGNPMNLAKLRHPLSFKSGEHELLIISAKYGTLAQRFVVKRNQQEVLQVSLVPKQNPLGEHGSPSASSSRD